MTTTNLVLIEGGGGTTFDRAAGQLMNKLMARKDWCWLQNAMMAMLGQENRFGRQLTEDFDAFFDEAYKKYGCPNCGKKGVPCGDGLLSCIECLRAEDEEGGAQ